MYQLKIITIKIVFFVPTAFCDLQTMLQFIAPDYDSFIKESEQKKIFCH